MSGALAGCAIRYWKISIALWLVLTVAACGIVSGWANSTGLLAIAVPQWNQVVTNGESVRLPTHLPSAQAESLYNKAFPDEPLTSSVVLVVHRDGSQLTAADRSFIEDALTPGLLAIHSEPGVTIQSVRDFNDRQIGQILDKRSGEATMIIADLEHDFLDQRNQLTVDRVQQLIDSNHGELKSKIPEGLKVSLGGSATVGRDLLTTLDEDSGRMQWWALVTVLCLSLVVYRAPLMALLPLAVVFASLQLSLALLILLAWAGASGFEPLTALRPFSGLQTFVLVIVYGTGLSYSAFLIARYRSELDRANSGDSALINALQQYRGSVIASVGMIGCGIGTMLIATFEKYQQVGCAMALSLAVTLICSLTLLPALLKMTGKRVFWPHKIADNGLRVVSPDHAAGARILLVPSFAERTWERVYRHPKVVWSTVVLLMVPFALIGLMLHNQTTFELLSDLPEGKTGVEGSRAVEQYFGPGQCGPVTVLFSNPEIDFSDSASFEAVEELITSLTDKKEELGIVDVRSLIHPLGLEIKTGFLARGIAKRHYISTAGEFADHVMRLDLLTADDAFSPVSRDRLQQIETHLRESLPESIRNGTELSFLGTTASVADLETVTDSDQVVLDGAVLAVILLVLCGLLRMASVPCYLICSVSFVYLTTLGLTTAIFWMANPDFAGIDWKVPLFLFTILVTIGQDYNVFLMSAIKNDQQRNGMLAGLRTAMATSGGAVSKCAIVTAGAYLSLAMAGQLNGSQQLGVALAIGILLDTVIARRVLLPAWLIIFNSQRVTVPARQTLRVKTGRLQELSASRMVL